LAIACAAEIICSSKLRFVSTFEDASFLGLSCDNLSAASSIAAAALNNSLVATTFGSFGSSHPASLSLYAHLLKSDIPLATRDEYW